MKYFEFIKMHGLGNDFVIIDKSQNLVEIKKNLAKMTLQRVKRCNIIEMLEILEKNNFIRRPMLQNEPIGYHTF